MKTKSSAYKNFLMVFSKPCDKASQTIAKDSKLTTEALCTPTFTLNHFDISPSRFIHISASMYISIIAPTSGSNTPVAIFITGHFIMHTYQKTGAERFYNWPYKTLKVYCKIIILKL